MKNAFSLKGQIERIAVIGADGTEILAIEAPQRNLLLDQGLNALGDDTAIDGSRAPSIAELFEYCVRGAGTTPTKETPAGSNTYSLSGTVLTRTAGTRNFTLADEGKLIRSADGKECIVTNFTSATTCDVRAVGSGALANFTNKTIDIYAVDQTALDAETDRTNTYSAVAGENATTDATSGGHLTGVRTLKRTFIFPPEAEHKEVVTGTYGTSGSTLTRASGARDFAAGDVGKYVKFTTSGQYAKIGSVTSATVAVLDRILSPAESGAAIELYGFGTYQEIGFSHLEDAGANLNIRLLLSAPVDVLGSNPETPGQQLKITYTMTVTAGPAAVVGPVAASITDAGSAMSSNKNGSYVLESLATSKIDADGSTNLDAVALEPYFGGYMALSPASTALSAFGGVDRSDGVEFTELTPQTYAADSFTRLYEGTFGINDAIGAQWRTMGIYDPDSELFALAFLFTGAQKKDGEHTITLRFRKSWGRDLS